MLTANAKLQSGPCCAPSFSGYANELTHPLNIKANEWVVG